MLKIVIIALILKIGFAAVWTRLAANVSQACECSSLTFNWQYSSTYTTQSITWQWASLSTADVIANFAPAPELGFVAYGLFKNRLQFTPTASVTVTSLTLTDPGVLVISILFYANLDFILPSSAVLSSVTPLDLCRSASTAVTLSENTTCLIYQGTPPVYSASATFSISCSWLRNGVIMLNSSVLVKVKVTGSGCGVGVYCYRCMVGTCTGQVDHVCRFITEYCQSASSIPNTSPSALAYSLPTGSEGAGGGPTCVVQWLVSCLSIVSTCFVAAMTVIIGLLSSQLQRLGQREYDVSGGLRHQAVLEHCH